MKKMVIRAVFSVLFLSGGLFGYNQMTLIDTPTPDTLLRGYYDVYFSSYEAGGIKTKVSIGLADRITLGISEDVGAAIGDKTPQWSIPGVIAKINIFKIEDARFGWAVGYDNFVEGEYGKVIMETNANGSTKRMEIIYGLYSAFSLPISILDGSFFSFGARFPLLPIKMDKSFSDLGLFAGINIGLNKELKFNGEIENISLVKTDKALGNMAIKYIVGDQLSVSLNFRYYFDKKLLSRSINIEYQNLFY
jgi:hypothetical protein